MNKTAGDQHSDHIKSSDLLYTFDLGRKLTNEDKKAVLELAFSEKINEIEIKRTLSAINWLHEIFSDGSSVKIDSIDLADEDKN